MTPIEFLLLIVLAVGLHLLEVVPTVQHGLTLLPVRIAAYGVWLHTGATIGFFCHAVSCANPAAGTVVTILLLAVAAGFAVRG